MHTHSPALREQAAAEVAQALAAFFVSTGRCQMSAAEVHEFLSLSEQLAEAALGEIAGRQVDALLERVGVSHA